MAQVIVKFLDDQEAVIAEFTSEKTTEELNLALQYFALATNYIETVYDSEGNSSPNPESKADYMIRKMKEYCEGVITSYAANIAADSARAQVLANPIVL